LPESRHQAGSRPFRRFNSIDGPRLKCNNGEATALLPSHSDVFHWSAPHLAAAVAARSIVPDHRVLSDLAAEVLHHPPEPALEKVRRAHSALLTGATPRGIALGSVIRLRRGAAGQVIEQPEEKL
jgi:hypothetical protein